MTSFFRLLFGFIALAALSQVVTGQSADQQDEMAFFDIDDGSDGNFFDIIVDQQGEPEEESKYSITGSIKQDFTYGIASPKEFFSRNQSGVEKLNSELFLQVQGRPSDNSKIKLSGIVDYDWGSWLNNAYALGGSDASFGLKDLFLDLTYDNGLWIRLGNQIVARGELESVKITDMVNPIDISAPGQVEFKDIRVQVPALFFSAPVGNATAEVILTNEAGADKVGTPEPGSAFDYSILNDQMAASLSDGISLKIEELEPNKTWEAIGRVNYKLNGGDISFTAGEVNWNQNSLQAVVESIPLVMQYGFDRVKVFGLSGNIVQGNYLFRYEAALNDGRKFQNVNPLTEWSAHQELVSGVGLEYSGLNDAVLSFEINNSNIVDYSRDLLPDENETGFVVQARWNGLNDLLSVYGAFNRLTGDNSTISTLFAEYELTDDVKLDARIIIYDARSKSDLLYTFKEQDVVKGSIKYSF